jgi:threonine dehydrogenase-like Zn-dependent dehydrogenase
MTTERRSLYFTSPGEVRVQEEELCSPERGQVCVRTLISAISPGTEMLLYRGQFPGELLLDENIASLNGSFSYPTKYGYSLVGRIMAVGEGVDPAWQGRRIFAFHPHETHFIAPLQELLPLPEDISLEDAVFLPNMETAVNFVMDGHPLIGERVVVFGQGIVGLLTTALLADFPLDQLITLDYYPLRRRASLAAGSHACLDASDADIVDQLKLLLPEGADLTYELSGSPGALDQAIAVTGFAGRIVIGSWYGSKKAELDLGGRFHRSRLQLISSQVSTLAPSLTARWTKDRRLDVAWDMLREVRPSDFITHRFAFHDATQAYRLIDTHPGDAIQVLLTYPAK